MQRHQLWHVFLLASSSKTFIFDDSFLRYEQFIVLWSPAYSHIVKTRLDTRSGCQNWTSSFVWFSLPIAFNFCLVSDWFWPHSRLLVHVFCLLPNNDGIVGKILTPRNTCFIKHFAFPNSLTWYTPQILQILPAEIVICLKRTHAISLVLILFVMAVYL